MRLIHGDCREVLAGLDAESVDAVVTDPPYELGFMGKAWDASGVAFQVETWEAVLRVLKPGGHMLAFGGTRTYHRIACAIEDAGFEIRDCLQWIYGSGFPKSMDVSKAIDKANGDVRTGGFVKAQQPAGGIGLGMNAQCANCGKWKLSPDPCRCVDSGPASDLSKQWQGWGTALKPAYEPIVLARKPLARTVAQNVQQHGTGAINVDGCRVGTDDTTSRPGTVSSGGILNVVPGGCVRQSETHALGRWPANILHDGSEEVVALFPSPHGAGAARDGSAAIVSSSYNASFYEFPPDRNMRRLGDSGSAARFFYCAKASRSERGDGNTHPTVKPLALMRYLVRLITPPNGLVLDPFTGSGTTGIAALREGMRFVGIEANEAYCEIAAKRLEKEVLPLEQYAV
jgi:DNA modification methylase